MTPITPQQQQQLPHGEPLPNTIPAPSLTGNGQGIVHGLDLDRSFEDKKRVRINPDVPMPDAPLVLRQMVRNKRSYCQWCHQKKNDRGHLGFGQSGKEREHLAPVREDTGQSEKEREHLAPVMKDTKSNDTTATALSSCSSSSGPNTQQSTPLLPIAESSSLSCNAPAQDKPIVAHDLVAPSTPQTYMTLATTVMKTIRFHMKMQLMTLMQLCLTTTLSRSLRLIRQMQMIHWNTLMIRMQVSATDPFQYGIQSIAFLSSMTGQATPSLMKIALHMQ